MFLHHSCCSWYEVRRGVYFLPKIYLNPLAGFGEFPDEAEAAYMTGVLGMFHRGLPDQALITITVSMFFLTQFLTSLLWVSSTNRTS
jgi:hypothetical protein